jgi:hypothetical protein
MVFTIGCDSKCCYFEKGAMPIPVMREVTNTNLLSKTFAFFQAGVFSFAFD